MRTEAKDMGSSPTTPRSPEAEGTAARRRDIAQRDAARARVRRLTMGVMTLSVAAAAVGGVALAAPAITAPGPTVVDGNKSTNAASLVVPGSTQQRPAAVTGGS